MNNFDSIKKILQQDNVDIAVPGSNQNGQYQKLDKE